MDVPRSASSLGPSQGQCGALKCRLGCASAIGIFLISAIFYIVESLSGGAKARTPGRRPRAPPRWPPG